MEYLKEKQETHSKIKDIVYTELKVQEYITSPIFTNEETNLLYALPSRSVNVKINFRNKFQNNLLCPLCQLKDDNQAHS